MIIYGINTVKEAVFAKRKIKKLYLDKKNTDQALILFFNDKEIKYELVTKSKLNELTNEQNHQGVVAVVSDYQYYDLEDIIYDQRPIRLLLLDEITDPHNLGAIIRTAAAVKLDGIIIGNHNQALISGTVAKTASGGLEYVKIVKVVNLNKTIEKLKKANVWIIGTDVNTHTNLIAFNVPNRSCFVIGAEGKGIRALVKKNCDFLVKIPIEPPLNSLNAAVAAGIILYKQYLGKYE